MDYIYKKLHFLAAEGQTPPPLADCPAKVQVFIYVFLYADNFPHDQIKKINSALCVVLTRTKKDPFPTKFYTSISRGIPYCVFLTVSREIRPFATVYNGKSVKKKTVSRC